MSQSPLRRVLKRTILGAVLAGALPAAAFAQGGGSDASPQAGTASSHPMTSESHMAAGPQTTEASHPTGSMAKHGGSPWVKSIQAALNRKEHAHLAVDGKMGIETRTALEKFQKAHGLKPTGRPTKATQQALGM